MLLTVKSRHSKHFQASMCAHYIARTRRCAAFGLLEVIAYVASTLQRSGCPVQVVHGNCSDCSCRSCWGAGAR